jgi:hypothetical protein
MLWDALGNAHYEVHPGVYSLQWRAKSDNFKNCKLLLLLADEVQHNPSQAFIPP